jgi:Flp pilus assembly protein TadG
MSLGVRSHAGSRAGATPADRGQSLVEFALVFPIFMMLLMGIMEFAFMFNAQLSLNYATRGAALVAAEAGNNANADCLVLRQVDADLSPPTSDDAVISVRIFSATETGNQLSPAIEQVYTRGGTTTCGNITVPYTRTKDTYPYNVRCSDLQRLSCPVTDPPTTGPGNTGVDIIGVRIDYRYTKLGPFGFDTTMVVSNEMRMEPIL